MSETVNMHEAKTTLSRLVERALAGEEILIARNGQPLVQLVPVSRAIQKMSSSWFSSRSRAALRRTAARRS